MEEEQCEHCGEYALVVDDQSGVYGCKECGRVSECENFQHYTGGFQDGEWCRAPGQVVTDQQAGLVGAELRRAQRDQMQLVDDLKGFASTLSLGRRAICEGESVLIETKHYYSTGAVEKNLFLAIVLYIATRRCMVPITLYEVSAAVGRPYRELVKKYRRLVKYCNLIIPGHNLSIYVDRFVDDLLGHLESKNWLSGCNESDGDDPTEELETILEFGELHASASRRRPSKKDILEAVFNLQEFVLNRMIIPGCKPLIFAGGVLAIAVESKYAIPKSAAVTAYLCNKLGLVESQIKGFKSKVRKDLFALCKQLPGFVNMASWRLRRNVTDVLRAWKAVMKLEKHCMEDEGDDPPVMVESERVGPTPLTELLQEASLIGDLSICKMNRGFCPLENYKLSFPMTMSRYMSPASIGMEGISTSSESEDESQGTAVGGEVGSTAKKRAPKRKRAFHKSLWEPVPVPGSKTLFTRSIAVEQHGPSDIRTHPRARPKLASRVSQQASQQQARLEARRVQSENVVQVATKSIAGSDEFERDGLSDLDDQEIGEYVLNPREAAVRMMLASGSGSESG